MITREQLKTFRTDFSKAVESLEKKYNVKIEVGAISYDSTHFTFKANCTALNENGKKEVDKSTFEAFKVALGLKGNLNDRYKASNGVIMTIVDIDPRKPKYPVLLEGSDGKKYKNTVQNVNIQLAIGKVA